MWMGRHFLSLGTVPQEYFLCFPLPTLGGLPTTGEGALGLSGLDSYEEQSCLGIVQLGSGSRDISAKLWKAERWGQVVAAQVAE